MNYCSECGGPVNPQSPSGDVHRRYVCSACGTIHYRNPAVLVACYVCVGNEILWLRRGIEPAQGLWALPGGYLERGETPEAAACRELLEETGVEVDERAMTIVSISTLLHMSQTHLVYRCHLEQKPPVRLTEEATEIAWFGAAALPWDELAFGTVTPQIEQIYRWLERDQFGVRVGVVDSTGSHYKHYPLR